MNNLNAVVCSIANDFIDPYFSWQPCDNCNSKLGGTRYDIIYREKLNGEILEASVCEDCFIILCA